MIYNKIKFINMLIFLTLDYIFSKLSNNNQWQINYFKYSVGRLSINDS